MKRLIISLFISSLIGLGLYAYNHHELCKKLVKEQNIKRIEWAGAAFDECMKTQKNVMFCTVSYHRAKKFIQYMDYEELKHANCHP